jgi:arylsulfatase A-like enzyme
MVTNLDFAPTMLDLAGIEKPVEMQGVSFRTVLEGETPDNWQASFYYHFQEYPDPAYICARHYGIRNERYKLIHYYFPTDEWEFFDLEKDPHEMQSTYYLAEKQDTIALMKQELQAMRDKYRDNVGPDVE